MKKTKVIILICIIFLITIGGTFIYNSSKKEKDILIKDNVFVLTEENQKDIQPLKVTENKIVFNVNPNYSKGDIIVSGIIDIAPNGFIRRVIDITKKDNQYIIKTENAVLTDVFEKAHITKKFELTEDGAKEIDVNDNDDNAEQMNMEVEKNAVSFISTDVQNTNIKSVVPAKTMSYLDTDDKYNFSKGFEFEEEGISAEGGIGIDVWIEIELDISHGDINFGIIAHDKIFGGLTVENGSDISEEFYEEIFNKSLPNLQFFVGFVPIVVTNEIQTDLNGTMQAQGSLETSLGIKSENSAGLLYSSKTNEIKEVNKNEYLSDGLEWNTDANFSSENSVNVLMHLITKLYGSAGTDIAIGVEGKLKGEALFSKDFLSSDGLNFAGSVDMSIYPKIQGGIVVTIPVIDKQLVNKTLFEAKLKPFWEKHWNSGENWEKELENLKKDNQQVDSVKPYENAYFSVDVPVEWGSKWNVSEENNSMNGIDSTLYSFSYIPENNTDYAPSGGGATVYVIDMNGDRPSAHYTRMFPAESCVYVGKSSNGYEIFKTEAGAGFFGDGMAKITIK